MTTSPLSGYTPDYDAYGYDAYSTGAYPTVGTAFADDATGTYAYVPRQAGHQDLSGQQHYGAYEQGYAPGHEQGHDQESGRGQDQTQQTYGYGYGYPGYDAGYDGTGAYPVADPAAYDPAGYDPAAYSPAGHDPTAYGTAEQQPATGAAGYDETGTYDVGTLWQQDPARQAPDAGAAGDGGASYAQADWDSGAYPAYGYGYGYDANGDTGVYERLPTAYGYMTTQDAGSAREYTATSVPEPAADHGSEHAAGSAADHDPADQLAEDVELFDAEFSGTDFDTDLPERLPDTEPDRHDYAADGDGFPPGEPVARSRRRKPAKRSALLTVAVPSVAVMGVAAVGAAAVTGVGAGQEAPKAQAEGQNTGKVAQPTTQLDRQLAGVSRDADDFADRASRTQERIDLKDRQAAAKKAAQQAAARKEALRPKFLLPVKQRGLSAYFGQAGVNWMALHTGIDFPVQVGTPVMAATDGTVRTQWNNSYGNMAIVTAADGTETWYCHLSSTKIRSGKVKAGEVIAYSGNTGNTTGPHLHFEVRPDGGTPIDPLPWLLAHGLDPR